MNTPDPKASHGALKPQLQLIPPALNTETALALVDGHPKYGPWNWRRSDVELMTYVGAMKRHIDLFINGQDINPESGAHHLGHVAANCGIVLDSLECGTLIDNRPPVRRRSPSMREQILASLTPPDKFSNTLP